MTTLYNPQKVEKHFRKYSKYVSELKSYYSNLSRQFKFTSKDKYKVNSLLDGEASEALRNLVPSLVRKKHGIFFTPLKISRMIANRISEKIETNIRIYDPCMGSGDLLLSCAKRIIKKGYSFDSNLEIIVNKIQGIDLYEPFVDLAKLRFILLAAKLSEDYKYLEDYNKISKKLKNFKTGNSLTIPLKFSKNDFIIVNPPYFQTNSFGNYSWTKGKTQFAAIYIDELIKRADIGTQLIAILPDVLRSGTNYEKWRSHILRNCDLLKVKILGRFDEFTDVDVFLLHLEINKNLKKNLINFKKPNENKTPKLNDLFNVKVGTVVPFRNKDSQKKQSYLTCKEANWWGETVKFSKTKFDGNLFLPPFVVVRRTSSPSEKHRAYASYVKGNKKIAVENHLIIISPKDGNADLCKELLVKLKDEKTNKWLNEKIRCRHLTVESIKSIPW